MPVRPYSQEELSLMMGRFYAMFQGHSSLVGIVVSAGVLSQLVDEAAGAYEECEMPVPECLSATREALVKLRDAFVPVALNGVMEVGGGGESRTRTS